MNTAAPLVWRFDQLPDFLADPSFPGNNEPQRLDEFIARWVQFIGSLWGWCDRAVFGIRYVCKEGRITVYFTASPFDASESAQLECEVQVLLRTYKLASGPALARIDFGVFRDDSMLANMALVRMRQHVSRSLWTVNRPAARTLDMFSRLKIGGTMDGASVPVVYPWAGPSGPFLAPMESLMSQPVACAVSIHLQPTKLRTHELQWISSMAQLGQTLSEQTRTEVNSTGGERKADPAAGLAARLFTDSLSRLSGGPFLVTVYCAAANGRVDAAKSLAGSMRSLVHTPHTQEKSKAETPLPSGADVLVVEGTTGSDREQYEKFAFKEPGGEDVTRLADLMDARGAATLFRLPASVRSGVPGIRVRQTPPDFHPGPRALKKPAEHLMLGRYYSAGPAYMPIRDLKKHALITGFTGSGKTVTVLQLVHQLWVDHGVPFLVLESAKQEYRGLASVEKIRAKSPALQVYTVGNELCVPFRFNPFELLPGVRVEAHVGKLQSCFEGAIPPIGPSASLISEALFRVYERFGWSLTDVYPANGKSMRQFPVLRDFVNEIEKVLEDRGYEGDIASNLHAALIGRFQPLLIGGKGRMFDTQHSNPGAKRLFSVPTVLEMNDLIIEDKALVVMFLLTLLREWREIDKSTAGELKHVTVVEEAHNVLEEVKSEGSGEGATKADTRYKAVQAFCAMLTEIRSMGEGLIIADQSPQKLAKDAIRNTNLQIAHQLRDDDDRKSIARAMIMEPEQQKFVAKLRPGQAALFRTGLEKATFIQVDLYYPEPGQLAEARGNPAAMEELRKMAGFGFDSLLSDDALKAYMDGVDPTLRSRRKLSLPFKGCGGCASQCTHRDAIFPTVGDAGRLATAGDWFTYHDADERAKKGISLEQFWDRGVKLAMDAARHAGAGESVDGAWCYFLHAWNRQLELRGPTEVAERWTDAAAGVEVGERARFEKVWRGLMKKP